ncbi:diphosphomevalonate decarboxylase [Nocardia sp. NPDC050408]|uniref:diphosphomevalonate decarboxylase n=1 Tax=Nocardia sp. NPDC050408 TaxID=3364319 RepID=UPI0037B0AD2A
MTNRPTRSETATARAHPNIALVKYWGKRDERLILPTAGSLSMTLDIFPTTTRVTLAPHAVADMVILDGAPTSAPVRDRVAQFLNLVRDLAGRTEFAVVDSVNTVPTGAGLASSASGFAALAVAAATAYGVASDSRSLSRLARRGSGSACRSVFGGFVVWHAGIDAGAAGDHSSYAEPIDSAGVDLALVIAVVDDGPKAVPSRTAMRHTADTSPYFRTWVQTCAADLGRMRAAIAEHDFAAIGEIAEGNALSMHAAMLAARPAIRYLSHASFAVLDRIQTLRTKGIGAYATIDAGPNVMALCRPADVADVATALSAVGEQITVYIAGPGPAATIVSEELP